MRHPGAGRFAQSGAVQVDVFVMGEALDLLLQVVGFDANGPLDACGAGVVVPMTANVDQMNLVRSFGMKPVCQLVHLHARHDTVDAVLAVELHSIDYARADGNGHNDSGHVSRDLKTVGESDKKIMEEKPNAAVGQDP